MNNIYNQRVLYCGMGSDILSPLLLCPELDTLYVIDIFDEAFCTDMETIECQRSDIKNILVDGHDGRSHSFFTREYFKTTEPGLLHYLTKSSTILDEKYDTELKRWYLKFQYCGKIRELISYERDFIEEWPREITDIGHLMFMGSFTTLDIASREAVVFKKMMKERLTMRFKIYALWWDHQHYDIFNRIVIKAGSEETREIATMEVKKRDIDWKFAIYRNRDDDCEFRYNVHKADMLSLRYALQLCEEELKAYLEEHPTKKRRIR